MDTFVVNITYTVILFCTSPDVTIRVWKTVYAFFSEPHFYKSRFSWAQSVILDGALTSFVQPWLYTLRHPTALKWLLNYLKTFTSLGISNRDSSWRISNGCAVFKQSLKTSPYFRWTVCQISNIETEIKQSIIWSHPLFFKSTSHTDLVKFGQHISSLIKYSTYNI